MSTLEAQEKGLRLIPTWLPVVSIFVSGIFGAGVSLATYRSQIGQLETRVEEQEQRIEKQAEKQSKSETEQLSLLLDIRDRLARVEGQLAK